MEYNLGSLQCHSTYVAAWELERHRHKVDTSSQELVHVQVYRLFRLQGIEIHFKGYMFFFSSIS